MNWAEIYQPVNELYQTADHPAPSPDFCHPERRVKTADNFGGSGISTWKTRGNTRHLTWRAGGGGGRLGWGLVWLISPTAYGFLMISPNLHDIWAMSFLILVVKSWFFWCYLGLHTDIKKPALSSHVQCIYPSSQFADPDPGSDAFLTRGSWMVKNKIRIRDEHPRSYFRELSNNFWVKNTQILWCGSLNTTTNTSSGYIG
jgi:hypothetical protein